MKTIFLGTGSASGIPDPFCSCEYCKKVRELGGKNLRKRSSFLLEDRILLDFSPDIRTQIIENKIDFNNIKGIILSHTHNDHLDIQELIKIKDSIHIFINEASYDWLNTQIKSGIKPKHIAKLAERTQHLNITPMKNFIPFEFEGFEFTPIEARHTGLNIGESGMNFIIKDRYNSTRLHASDTGVYSEKTFNFIKNYKLDSVIIECTFLDCNKNNVDHLDLKSLKKVLTKLESFGSITSKTPIVITHFGHDPMKTHKEIEELVKKLQFNISVAYDSMEYMTSMSDKIEENL
ncbi:MBL fold metallo-hydrolase [Cetobacterium sp.]|uniref:MBL fold metallo-hydrolase n=1 Tax=Cetobacterium sp. TaxID=2071632 RepID=UPI003F2F9D8A